MCINFNEDFIWSLRVSVFYDFVDALPISDAFLHKVFKILGVLFKITLYIGILFCSFYF